MIGDPTLLHKELIRAHRRLSGPFSSSFLLDQLCNDTVLAAVLLSMSILIAPNLWSVYPGLTCIRPHQVPIHKGRQMHFVKVHISPPRLGQQLKAE